VANKHILFLTDNFPPEVNAPANRTYEHCRKWVEAGHTVTVITCAPNFPKGELFPGYRNRPWQRETMSGIRLIRVWTYITANKGFFRRTLDYMSFMASATVASLFVSRVDVVIGTSPHIFTPCAAFVVGWLKRVPFVFELRDLWPASIRAVGAMKDSLLLRALERLEMFLYRRAARIVSVTQSFKLDLVRRGIESAKIVVVTNGVDTERFRPRPRNARLAASLGLRDKFVAGYIGTHGMAHALHTLLEAAARLRNDPAGRGIAFVFLGDGAEKANLERQAQSMGLDNVRFLDTVARDEVPEFWSLLDVAIVHLKRSEVFKTVIPSKLFEAMSMGIPVLLGVEGEAAEMVRREACGRVFEPENADALCAHLLDLSGQPAVREHYRRNALNARANYDRAILAQRMLSEIEAIVTPPQGTTLSDAKRSRAAGSHRPGL
jgi:glycosyltransferase involved in cell wall biosynthesis